MSITVCLKKCPSYGMVRDVLPDMLERAGLFEGRNLCGQSILVKPNLLRALPLACTEPGVVAALCAWLKDNGSKVKVADSPGFGTASGVARAIGLDRALAPLGIAVEPMGPGRVVPLACGSRIRISQTALDADAIISVPRIKAHSQMRLTLSCKNLYGCVPGLFKALYHTREGNAPEHFARMQADILRTLPPAAAVADGIVAMHVTGPAHGQPFELGLLGVSDSPVALDEAIVLALGKRLHDIPLQRAFLQAGHPESAAGSQQKIFPFLKPEDFLPEGFVLPDHLLHTSFRPLRLVKSCLKRLWLEHFA